MAGIPAAEYRLAPPDAAEEKPMNRMEKRIQNRNGLVLTNSIKKWREYQGMSQIDLARKVGMSQQCICKYEHGDATPNIAAALLIAQALGTNPANIWQLSEDL